MDQRVVQLSHKSLLGLVFLGEQCYFWVDIIMSPKINISTCIGYFFYLRFPFLKTPCLKTDIKNMCIAHNIAHPKVMMLTSPSRSILWFVSQPCAWCKVVLPKYDTYSSNTHSLKGSQSGVARICFKSLHFWITSRSLL